MSAFPDAQYRHLFHIGEVAGIMELLDFRNETTWKFQEDGRRQAQEALLLGEGTAFKALDDYVADEQAMEEKWGSF